MREPSKLFSNRFYNKKKQKNVYCGAAVYESIENIEKRAKMSYAKIGSGKFVSAGTIARLKGEPYNITNNMTNKGDVISYHYGYYERGNNAVRLLVENKVCDIDGLIITPEEAENSLYKIAVNDGKNPEIILEDLPESVRNNITYQVGFMQGQLLAPQPKVKKRTR